MKQRQRGSHDITVKSELALRASEKLREKDKEKESRGIVAAIERKGEREFVVMTVRLFDLLSPLPTILNMAHSQRRPTVTLQRPRVWQTHGWIRLMVRLLSSNEHYHKHGHSLLS